MFKSTFTALCAFCLAGTVFAAQPKIDLAGLLEQPIKQSECNGKILAPAVPNSKKAPARLQDFTPIIDERPAGEVVQTMNVGSGYTRWYQYIVTFQNTTSSVNHVVYGDDGYVYIFNPMVLGETDTYVRGYIEDGKLNIPLPQTVDLEYEDGYPYGLNLALLDYVVYENGAGWMEDTGATVVQFDVNEDGSFTYCAEGQQALGYVLTYDNNWLGYAMTELTITPFNETPLEEIPSTAEISDAGVFVNPVFGNTLMFAKDGNDVYLKNFFPQLPDACLRASIPVDRPNTLEIPNMQYMGIYGEAPSASYAYLVFGKRIGENEMGLWQYEIMPDDYLYVMNYNEETRRYEPADPDIYVSMNNGKYAYDCINSVEYIEYYIIMQDNYYGTPRLPEIVNFYEWADFDQVYIQFATLSTEGTMLDYNYLYYSIYIDGDIYEFDSGIYELDEDLTEMPYNFTIDSWWLPAISGMNYNYWFAGQRSIYLYVMDYETIGIQSIYRYPGQEPTYTDIRTYRVDGVEGVDADLNKEVSSVAYYDLAGRTVANPTNGIYLKRTTYTDGTTTTVKKAIR